MCSLKFLVTNLFVVNVLLISGNLFAQTFKWEFGLEGGAGIRTLRIDPEYPSLITKAGVSFTGGIAGQYNLNDIWSVKLGAAYEKKGSNIERTDILTMGKVNFDYISIPLLLKAKFGKKIEFFVNAGPYLGILLSSYNRLDANSNFPETETNTDSTTKKTDFGISAGIGVEIPVGRSGALTIEVRDNFGLSNISKSKETNAPEIKTNTVNFMIGYVFKFGQKFIRKKRPINELTD